MSLQPLPPLTALRAFEAASRHKSFTKAANELNMTQAAVSYQIKQLEDRFGEPLFIRGTRQVSLSEAGVRLAPSITEAFEIIRRSFAEAKGHADGLLTITTSQTFASSWLARHLGGFQVHCDELAVKLDISNTSYDDFQSAGVDVAIRTGLGDWDGLVARKIMHIDYTPMLSPSLAKRSGGVPKHPQDLLEMQLIDPEDLWWRKWLEGAGADASALKTARGLRYGTQAMDGIVAQSGHGVGILTPSFYRDELASGLLIQPFEHVQKEEFAIWLCYPERRKNWSKIKIFENWLFPMLDKTMPDRRV
ncbi:LysR family transcriptional regulator [Maritalea sp.]|uniref:LysR family transcriptional regulator n=1 Tax=Maritalea sp. TaxID=2003361 RepID=UPI003EF32903